MSIHKQAKENPSAPKSLWKPAAPGEEANQRIENLLESITDAFVTVDREWHFTYVNKMAAQLMRKPRSELLGKEGWELFPEIKESRFYTELNQAMAAGIPTHFEAFYPPFDLWCECNAYPSPSGLSIFFRDITERKRMAETLAKNQQYLKEALRAANAGYYEFSIDLSRGSVDARLAEIWGYVLEEIPPMPALWNWWEQRLHPNDREQVLQAYHDFVQGLNLTYCQEYRTRHKDGSWRWCRTVSVTVERDATGQATTVAGLTFDITEQRQAGEALRESEQRFRVLAETVPDIIFTSDPDGLRDYANAQFYQYTQLSTGAAGGFGWMEALHPDDLAPTKARWMHSIQTGEAFKAQYRIRNAHGHYRWFQGRARPICDESGQITKWFGVASDIDDLVRVQEALKEADRCKNEFLAMLGHELRNPLVPICNAVELLRIHPEQPTIQSKAVALIERQAKHLTRLVDDLLNVARIVTGKINLKPEQVELGELVGRAIEIIQPALETAHHRLTLSFPKQPLKVEADPVRLVQIIANLLHNAIKYTPPEGSIHLQLEQGAKNQAILRIRDNGIGIPAEKLPYIFDLFTQAAPTPLDPTHPGLGIGLTLAQRLIEMHGGKIFVSSEGSGKGSEFSVHLPLISNLVACETPPLRPSISQPTSQRILVVDDEADVRTSFALLLEAMGHNVQSATDGLSALQAAQNFHPCIVFLDICMPGMDDYEVAHRLRLKYPQEQMLLVAWTDYDLKEYRERAEQVGFDHYLLKPIGLDTLEALLASPALASTV
jgi:PAS domain S-box-containing protein